MLLFLMSVGLSVTLGLMRFVTLVHGAFAMLGGYVCVLRLNHAGVRDSPSRKRGQRHADQECRSGRGYTVVAGSLKLAVYQAIYTEVNTRIQADALRLGPVTYLSAAEVAGANVNIEKQANRPWKLWKQQAAQK